MAKTIASKTTEKRPRPSYMLIFTEMLKRHNDEQTKYIPGDVIGTSKTVTTTITTNQKSDKPVEQQADNARLMKQLNDRLVKNITQGVANSNAVQLALEQQHSHQKSAERSLSLQRDFQSARDLSVTSVPTNHTGLSSLNTGNYKQIEVTTITPSKQTTGELINRATNEPTDQVSSAQTKQQTVTVAEETSVSPQTLERQVNQQQVQAEPVAKISSLERQQLEQISRLLDQQRERNIQQLQAIKQEQQEDKKQVAKLQSKSESGSERETTNMTPGISPANRPVRTVMKGVKNAKVAATKDSNAPSLAHTPAAAVGNSSSAQAGNLGRPTPKANQKKISISKIIAEQTPGAFKTFVNVKNPGEKSGQNQPNVNVIANPPISTIDAIPSDYEHIFHYPSSMVDETKLVQNKNITDDHARHHHHDRRNQRVNQAQTPKGGVKNQNQEKQNKKHKRPLAGEKKPK